MPYRKATKGATATRKATAKRAATRKAAGTSKVKDETKATPKAQGSTKPESSGDNQVKAQIERTARGTSKKGVSGNPAGKPKGTKDKFSKSLLERMGERGPDVVEQVLNLAIEKGDVTAARLVLERLVAKADSQLLDWDYCTPLETAEDIQKEMKALLRGVGEGRITPGGAKVVRELLESTAESIQRATMGDVRQAFELDERVLVQIRARPELFAAASRFAGLLGAFYLESQHPVIDMARAIAPVQKTLPASSNSND
jgi:hypothetical protein